MNPRTRVAVVIAVAVLLSGCSACQKRGAKFPAAGGHVHVMGGSITIRSNSPWNCGAGPPRPTNPCQTSVVVSTIVFKNFSNTLPQIKSAAAWKLEVFARDIDGNSTSLVNGIQVCSNPQCNLASNSCVFLMPMGTGGFYTLNSHGKSADAPHESGVEGKRYHDTGQSCHVEQGDLCEHFGTVRVTVPGKQPQTAVCTDGECEIDLDQ